MRLPESSIAAWKYVPAKDPEKLLYDFYFIIGFLSPTELDSKEIRLAKTDIITDCVQYMRTHMLQVVEWAVYSEFRHIYDHAEIDPSDQQTWGEKTRAVYRAVKKQIAFDKKNRVTITLPPELEAFMIDDPDSRHVSYLAAWGAAKEVERTLGLTTIEVMKAIKEIFTSADWEDMYGGEAWVAIADAYIKLAEAPTLIQKIIYIDHVYDLEHNTGSIFEKVYSYIRSGLQWLSAALDWKHSVTNVWDYYDVVSTRMKPLVAAVAYSITGKTLEDIEGELKAQKAPTAETVGLSSKEFVRLIEFLDTVIRDFGTSQALLGDDVNRDRPIRNILTALEDPYSLTSILDVTDVIGSSPFGSLLRKKKYLTAASTILEWVAKREKPSEEFISLEEYL